MLYLQRHFSPGMTAFSNYLNQIKKNMWSNQWLCCCYFYLCCCYGYCYFCCCCCCWMLCGSGRPGPTLLIKPRSGVSPGRLHICWQAVRLDAYPAPSNWSSQANFFFSQFPPFLFSFSILTLTDYQTGATWDWFGPARHHRHRLSQKHTKEIIKDREREWKRERKWDTETETETWVLIMARLENYVIY